jgi:hypothetical protein
VPGISRKPPLLLLLLLLLLRLVHHPATQGTQVLSSHMLQQQRLA